MKTDCPTAEAYNTLLTITCIYTDSYIGTTNILDYLTYVTLTDSNHVDR